MALDTPRFEPPTASLSRPTGLLGRMAAGECRVAVTFAGQGVDVLPGIVAQLDRRPELHPRLETAAALLHDMAMSPAGRASGRFRLGFDLSEWVIDPEGAPPPEYLRSCAVSYPLVLLSQLLAWEELWAEGFGAAVDAGAVVAVTGHSQGLLAALAVAEEPVGPLDDDRLTRYLTLAFYQGLHKSTAATAMPSPTPPSSATGALGGTADGVGGEAGPSGNGTGSRPGGAPSAGWVGPTSSSPMAAVSGVRLDRLTEIVDETNAALRRAAGLGDSVAAALRSGGEVPEVVIGLVNASDRVVVSGHPAALDALRARLDQIAQAEAAERRAGRRGGAPLQHRWEPLLVDVAFHSPVLDAALQRHLDWLSEARLLPGPDDLALPVLSPFDGHDLRSASDTGGSGGDDGESRQGDEGLMVAVARSQFVQPVRWDTAVGQLVERGADWVLDLGPGTGVAQLTGRNLRGTGARVLPLASPEGHRVLVTPGVAPERPDLRYTDFAPGIVELPDGTRHVDNRYSRRTGQPPVILPGMTPTTADVPIVAAAANAGFTAELAGGGQPTGWVFRERMAELRETLAPGAGVVFNTLLLDRPLWNLHIDGEGLVFEAKQSGVPLVGLTVSAGVPEADEAVALLDRLAEAGMVHNAFKPGTVEQVRQVLAIADAAPHHTVFVHLEGGKAGGHHSFEDLDELLLATYHDLRRRPNVVLGVGGGVGTPERAADLLSGRWAVVHGEPPMPVDAVLVGTAAMACAEATASPQVKAALTAAPGTPWWVPRRGVAGGVYSGRSPLNADIHTLDNAAARAADLLLEVTGDEAALAARRDEIVEALSRTAKPYFGDLDTMTYAAVLDRFAELCAIGRSRRYGDGAWGDPTWRSRALDLYRRFAARLTPEDRGRIVPPVGRLADLDDPAAALARFQAAYPHADAITLHPADRWFFLEVCDRPGKPVPFVPVLDSEARRWYMADALWQAQDDRYDADAVFVIPGPESVAGITRPDEPVAELLARFEQASIDQLTAAGVVPAHRDRLADEGLAPAPFPALAQGRSGPLAALCLAPFLVAPTSPPPAEQPPPAAEGDGAGGADGPVGVHRPVASSGDRPGQPPSPGPGATPNPLWELIAPADDVTVEVDDDGMLRRVESEPFEGAPGERVVAELVDGGITITVSIPALPPLGTTGRSRPPAASPLDQSSFVDLVRRVVPLGPGGSAPFAEVGGPAARASFYAAALVVSPSSSLLAGDASDSAGSSAVGALSDELSRPSSGDPSATVASEAPDIAVVGSPLAASPASGSSRGASVDGPSRLAPPGGVPGRVADDGLPQPQVVTWRNDVDRVGAYRAVTGARHGGVPLDWAFSLGWPALVRLLVESDLAPQLAHLVHSHHRVEPGPAWPPQPGESGTAEARVVAIRNGASDRRIDVTVELRSDRGRVALVDAGLLVRQPAPPGSAGSPGEVRQSTPPGSSGSTGEVSSVVPVVSDRDPVVGSPAGATRRERPRLELARAEDVAPGDMTSFALIGGDHNPLHRSLLAARLAGLDEPIVHGMWTAARAGAFVVDEVCGGEPGRLVDWSVRFTAPVPLGGLLSFDAARVAVDGGRLRVEVVVRDVGSDEADADDGSGSGSGDAGAGPGAARTGKVVALATALVAPPRTALVFPGQGIQKAGLGAEGRARSRAARAVWAQADAHTRARFGFSLLDVVDRNPTEIRLVGSLSTPRVLSPAGPAAPGVSRPRTSSAGPSPSLLASDEPGSPTARNRRASGKTYSSRAVETGDGSPARRATAPAPAPARVGDDDGDGTGAGSERIGASEVGISAPPAEATDALGAAAETSGRTDPGSGTVAGWLRHPGGVLHRTEITQAALVTLAAAQLAELRAAGALPEDLQSADVVVAGHSVGELSALVALGVLDLGTALDLAFCRGQAMQEVVPRGPDGASPYRLAAVDPGALGDGGVAVLDGLVAEIADEPGELLQVVNRNGHGRQYVVAGTQPGTIDRLARRLDALVGRGTDRSLSPASPVTVLAGIDVPFHSSVLVPAIDRFRPHLESALGRVDHRRLVGRWVPNLVGRPFALDAPFVAEVVALTGSTDPVLLAAKSPGGTSSPADFGKGSVDGDDVARRLVVELLAHQLANPVRWIDVQRALVTPVVLGAARQVEMAPAHAAVLTNLAAANLSGVTTTSPEILHVERDRDRVLFTDLPADPDPQDTDELDEGSASVARLPVHPDGSGPTSTAGTDRSGSVDQSIGVGGGVSSGAASVASAGSVDRSASVGHRPGGSDRFAAGPVDRSVGVGGAGSLGAGPVASAGSGSVSVGDGGAGVRLAGADVPATGFGGASAGGRSGEDWAAGAGAPALGSGGVPAGDGRAGTRAAGAGGPVAEDRVVSAGEALRLVLAVQARVRLDQLDEDETLDELFQGVSSRRNQVLIDLGREFALSGTEGVHEVPLLRLADEIAQRAPRYRFPGPYLRDTVSAGLARALSRAGLSRREALGHLATAWGLGPGLAEHVLATVALETRPGESARGGALGRFGRDLPDSTTAARELLDRSVETVARELGIGLTRVSAPGTVPVDDEAVRQAGVRLEQALVGAARHLLSALDHGHHDHGHGHGHGGARAIADPRADGGTRTQPAGAGTGGGSPRAPRPVDGEPVDPAQRLAVLDRELGPDRAAQVAGKFDHRRHVCFASGWTFARWDLVALYHDARDRRRPPEELHAEAERLALHADDTAMRATVDWFTARARQAGRDDVVELLATIRTRRRTPLPIPSARPTVETTPAGTVAAGEGSVASGSGEQADRAVDVADWSSGEPGDAGAGSGGSVAGLELPGRLAELIEGLEAGDGRAPVRVPAASERRVDSGGGAPPASGGGPSAWGGRSSAPDGAPSTLGGDWSATSGALAASGGDGPASSGDWSAASAGRALAATLRRSLVEAPDFSGEVALVTGASPGSIAAELVRQLLRGGATVVVATSTDTPERRRWYRELYRTAAAPGAALHVLPANLASFADIDALVAWLDEPVTPIRGRPDLQPGPLVPTLLAPFAAVPTVGDARQAGAGAETALRVQLLGVERLTAAVVDLAGRRGAAEPVTVLLPLSPNLGDFGGDGPYGETKAALDVLARRARAERDDWGRYARFLRARIGWVRGTGLMRRNDPVAPLVEQRLGVRTFSPAEMGWLLATATGLHRTGLDLDELDLTGGLADIDGLRDAIAPLAEELMASVDQQPGSPLASGNGAAAPDADELTVAALPSFSDFLTASGVSHNARRVIGEPGSSLARSGDVGLAEPIRGGGTPRAAELAGDNRRGVVRRPTSPPTTGNGALTSGTGADARSASSAASWPTPMRRATNAVDSADAGGGVLGPVADDVDSAADVRVPASGQPATSAGRGGRDGGGQLGTETGPAVPSPTSERANSIPDDAGGGAPPGADPRGPEGAGCPASGSPGRWGLSGSAPELAAEEMVVIVGVGELGPCGTALSRFALELDGPLPAAVVVELAWLCGLVRYQRDGYRGRWVDTASGDAVDEAELADRYADAVREGVGLRPLEADGVIDPEGMEVLATVPLETDLTFEVASEAEARSFLAADPAHTRIDHDPSDGTWRVTRRAGSPVRATRRVDHSRRVAGQFPTGLDLSRFGIPGDLLVTADRLALVNLACTAEAFRQAGLEPEELLQAVHPAQVANTQGCGMGGMLSLRRLLRDQLLGDERQNDRLQESLGNVVAAHVVQGYVGSYGPMVHPVAACATAAVSLEEAWDKIRLGKARAVVAGGFDDLIPEGMVGFGDMHATADSDALEAMGLAPDESSRANDVRRRGFVESQGGGSLLVVRGDVALDLGLPVLGVLAYAGTFADGVHSSIPAPGMGLLAAGVGGSASPLAESLRRHGLTVDDIAVVSKHDTSTEQNDPNEADLHQRLQQALGRTPGNPLMVVSQKTVTGHPKGGAAAWQVGGVLQMMASGQVPGNRNLESVDPLLRACDHLVHGHRPLRLAGDEPLRAALVTSLGFGHVSALLALAHPDTFLAALPDEMRDDYLRRAGERRARATRSLLAVRHGEAPPLRRTDRRLGGPSSDPVAREAEAAVLLDPASRFVPAPTSNDDGNPMRGGHPPAGRLVPGAGKERVEEHW